MMNNTRIKPCPFCGVTPKIYWEPWPEISNDSGIYHLEAEHKPNCFIRHINGMNPLGKCSAANKEWLLETWNNRYEGTEEQENESDYIKREDVISDLRDLWDYKTVDGIRSSEVLKQVQEDVKSVPPADVVEVVRCKDCEHWKCNPNTDKYGVCKKVSYDDFEVVMNVDDFCSYGEPKEQENE